MNNTPKFEDSRLDMMAFEHKRCFAPPLNTFEETKKQSKYYVAFVAKKWNAFAVADIEAFLVVVEMEKAEPLYSRPSMERVETAIVTFD